MRLAGSILRFSRDQGGSIAVLAALSMTLVIGFAAMAIDSGSFYLQKRRQQAATDLAAIGAASNMSAPLTAATATLALDGYAPSAIVSLETGVYAADGSLAPGRRFTPLAGGAGNAVRLTLATSTPTILGRIFGQTAFPLRTQSVATQANLASFGIGTQLANLDGGIENAVLGGMLGTSLSLSLMDYQSLANVDIDLFAFSNALGARLNLTGTTYGQLAASSVSLSDAMNAIADAARLSPNGTSALPALSELSSTLSRPAPSVGLAPVIAFGPYAQIGLGSAAPTGVSVSALDLVSALAQAANGTRQITTAIDVSAFGLASATLTLAIGQQPAGTSFVALGAQGATVHTAQTRLLLTLQIAPVGISALVNVPIALDLAAGTAVLASVACQPGDVTTSSVTLNVTPGVVDAWIGAVQAGDLTNLSAPLQPGAATLLTLGAASVTGLAHAAMTNLATTSLAYSYADIAQVSQKTTSTQDFAASLVASLFGALQVKVTIIGLGLGLPSNLDKITAATLGNASTPIDQLIHCILASLGLGLGNAVSWVGGVRCGSAVLVN